LKEEERPCCDGEEPVMLQTSEFLSLPLALFSPPFLPLSPCLLPPHLSHLMRLKPPSTALIWSPTQCLGPTAPHVHEGCSRMSAPFWEACRGEETKEEEEIKEKEIKGRGRVVKR
jgi:hypothetical protein